MTDTLDREIALADVPMARDLVPQDRRLLPAPLEQLYEVADLMATGGVLVPKAFRGQRELCLGVAYQAALWGTDPIATINKAYVVNDRIAYEAQLINAIVLGHLESRPKYTYQGAGATRQCRVVATPKGSGERDYTSPQVGQVKVKNSPLWVTDPDQQLSYMCIRAWARRHMPDVLLGIYAVEELQQISIRDVTPPPPADLDGDMPEPEDAAFEEATQDAPFEPSGGFTTDGDAPPTDETLRTGEVADDILAWAEGMKVDASNAKTPDELQALWDACEANRRKLWRTERHAHDELEIAFKDRLADLG